MKIVVIDVWSVAVVPIGMPSGVTVGRLVGVSLRIIDGADWRTLVAQPVDLVPTLCLARARTGALGLSLLS